MAVAEASVPLKVGAVLAFTLTLNVLLADAPMGSVAVSVTELTPEADGVPVIAPVPELILKPAGKPTAVYVSVWPALGSVKAPVGRLKLKVEPTVLVEEVNVPLKTGGRLGPTVMPNSPEVDKPPVSRAVSVTELVPVADGVPVIAPVPAFTLSPAGKPVAV